MPGIDDIMARFIALHMRYGELSDPCWGDFKRVATHDGNFRLYYLLESKRWMLDTLALNRHGLVSESNVLALLEALERLLAEARESE